MNTNDSNDGALVKTSEKQRAANRSNAKKSTGPKTRTGKALVALNSVAHGIYSVSPVIVEMESKRSWTAYRFAMLDRLAPVGMVEMTLAERIILSAWRLRRVARYETEQIRSDQEKTLQRVGRTLGYDLGKQVTAPEVREILGDAEWKERSWHRVSMLFNGSDDTAFTEEDAEDLLWYAHDQLGQTEGFERYCEQLPAVEAWTNGLIRQLIRGLVEQHQQPFDEFLRSLKDRVTAEWAESNGKAEKALAYAQEDRRDHLLPDTPTLEKIARYESHLSRQFHRDLHELQRLQAARLGHPVAVPIAIDVNVTSEPKSEPGGAE